jgi:MFS family permease
MTVTTESRASSEPSGPSGSSAAPAPSQWRNRAYLLLMSGKTTQLVGAGVGAFAVPLVAYAITGSVGRAGLIAGIGEAGALLATLPAGVLADRMDRRRLIVAAAAVGAVAWASVVAAGFAGRLTGVHLAAVLFVSSVVGAVVGPAEQGGIRAVVDTDRMPQAMAAVQGRAAVATLVAAPAGGFLYGVAHALPFLASALGHLVVAACAWFVRTPLNPSVPDERRERSRPVRALREGIAFALRVPLIRAELVLGPLVNVLVNAMLVGINLELVRTGVSPMRIALVDLVSGAAMLLGALVAGRVLEVVRAGPLLVGEVALLAVCGVGMALLHTYWAYVVLLAVAVLPLPASNAGVQGYVMAVTPHGVQGRLSSVLGVGGLMSAPVAPVLGGALLARLGLVSMLGLLAAGLVVVAGCFATLRPLWRIGTPDTWAADVLPWPAA